MILKKLSVAAAISAAVFTSHAHGAIIYHPVVNTVNAGGAVVSSTGYSNEIRVYKNSVAGQVTPYSSLAYNSSSSGTRLVISGSATSEGSLTNNPSLTNAAAQGLTYSGVQSVYSAGYDAANGTASVNGATANANRSLGRAIFDVDGIVTSAAVIQTQTQATAYSANNFRGATADDTGTAKFTAGTGGGTSNGWRNFASNTRLHTTPTNVRTVELLTGGLFGSTGSGTVGIYSLNPAGNDTTTATLYLGTGTGRSPYEFVLFDDPSLAVTTNLGYDTAYVADDSASFGGIQKWTWDGSVWTNNYTLKDGALTAYRGLAGQLDADTGRFTLFATVEDTTTTRLQQVTDIGASSPFITLASELKAGGEIFRGVSLVAIPEPSTFVLGGLSLLGLVGYAARRRRMKQA